MVTNHFILLVHMNSQTFPSVWRFKWTEGVAITLELSNFQRHNNSSLMEMLLVALINSFRLLRIKITQWKRAILNLGSSWSETVTLWSLMKLCSKWGLTTITDKTAADGIQNYLYRMNQFSRFGTGLNFLNGRVFFWNQRTLFELCHQPRFAVSNYKSISTTMQVFFFPHLQRG